MELRPVKIFASGNVPRLNYIAEIILQDILGLSWEIITDRRRLGKNPVINYSAGSLQGALKISPDTLLFEEGIRERDIIVKEWDDLPVFFPTSSDSDFPFDIFAASFYLISRYEEYLDFESDESGRFKASGSLAFKHGFLGLPVVELWTKRFAKVMAGRFRSMAFKPGDYKTIVTINTGDPLAGQGTSILGNITGFLKDFTSKKEYSKNIEKEGIGTSGVVEYLSESVKKCSAESRFFFSVGAPSHYEANPSWRNSEFRKIICRTSDEFAAGIHASVNASVSTATAAKEIYRLRTIIKKDILFSRFNLSRIVMPSSYRIVCDAGIKEDYSMGYPEEPGFRAGISRPFRFYDIPEEKVTGLRIVPFQATDLALLEYKKLTPEEARSVIAGMIDKTKLAGGWFVSIWHDSSFYKDCGGEDWRELFEFTLDKQVQ